MSKIDAILDQEKIHRFEGESGVRNLAVLCRLIGYSDETHFGQFSHKGCYGDLIRFLEDNPGAVEAVVEFIRDNEDSYDIDVADPDEESEEE